MKNFEQAEGKKPYDMVIYSLQKFFKLASECNPNIIEILNTDPEDWILETPIFHKLWESRDLFLSKKAKFTFSGYALSQLKRIKSHKKWLLDPPTHHPSREEYGLPAQQKMSQSELGATKSLIENGTKLDENVWTYDQLIEWADKQDSELQSLYDKSLLPAKPQYQKLDELCQEITEQALSKHILR